jgi:hypothetical protein
MSSNDDSEIISIKEAERQDTCPGQTSSYYIIVILTFVYGVIIISPELV